MAMKPCRECGKEVSTDASACPHCGKPSPHRATISNGRGLLILAVLGALALGFVARAGDNTRRELLTPARFPPPPSEPVDTSAPPGWRRVQGAKAWWVLPDSIRWLDDSTARFLTRDSLLPDLITLRIIQVRCHAPYSEIWLADSGMSSSRWKRDQNAEWELVRPSTPASSRLWGMCAIARGTK